MAKEEKRDLVYIMNPSCGWCKRSDPVVEELKKGGYDITILDVQNPNDAERANEIKSKYNARCGTPLFIDAESGNSVCGFRPKEILEQWADGKEIPAPTPPVRSPKNRDNADCGCGKKGDSSESNDIKNMLSPDIPFIKFEYVWLDGSSSKKLRSKVKFIDLKDLNAKSPEEMLSKLPELSFDGSSTGQSKTDSSDCILKPIKAIPYRIDRTPSFIILCEVMNPDGTPHKTNTRSKMRETLEKVAGNGMIFGIEQEFVLTDPFTGKPLGWDKYNSDTPPPQGDYYCGVGSDVTVGRDIVESFLIASAGAGIPLDGINAEVMLSQWEYQTKPKDALVASDELWITRFILQKVAERMKVGISYDPKLIDGDWNGSGGHINFSSEHMRKNADIDYMNLLCSSMSTYHDKAIEVYGVGNDRRLTGKNETSFVNNFSWGELDRTASIRIPSETVKNNGKGYLEDRRPSANFDPYEAFNYLLKVYNNINEELFVAN